MWEVGLPGAALVVKRGMGWRWGVARAPAGAPGFLLGRFPGVSLPLPPLATGSRAAGSVGWRGGERPTTDGCSGSKGRSVSAGGRVRAAPLTMGRAFSPWHWACTIPRPLAQAGMAVGLWPWDYREWRPEGAMAVRDDVEPGVRGGGQWTAVGCPWFLAPGCGALNTDLRPPTSDLRPPTSDLRPLITGHCPSTADCRPPPSGPAGTFWNEVRNRRMAATVMQESATLKLGKYSLPLSLAYQGPRRKWRKSTT